MVVLVSFSLVLVSLEFAVAYFVFCLRLVLGSRVVCVVCISWQCVLCSVMCE